MKIVCHTRRHTHTHAHMPLIYFALRIIQIKISQLTVLRPHILILILILFLLFSSSPLSLPMNPIPPTQ